MSQSSAAERQSEKLVEAGRSERTEFLLFDVDLAVEEEQNKRNSEQWSQQRLDNPEQEPGEVERLRL